MTRPACRTQLARAFLLAQGLGAGIAWFLLPHGFSLGDSLGWANGASLALLTAASSAGWVGALRGRVGPLRAAAALWLALWLGIGASLWFVFPHTGLRALPLVAVALAWSAAGLALSGRPPRRVLWTLGVVGLFLGAHQVVARRGADPATRPLNPAPRVALPRAGMGPLGPASVDAAGWVRLGLAQGARLSLDPFLRFRSRSPDRAWTILAGREAHRRVYFPLEGVGRSSVGRSPEAALFEFGGVQPGQLWASSEPKRLRLDARRTLSEAVYSHLNHAWVAEVTGQRGRWWIQFGAEGEQIEVLTRDYPVGRPARCAVLRSRTRLEVLEAESAEKGPFQVLSSLELSGPLVVSIGCDEERLVRLTLPDWAAQASLQRSPTAGWGLPENAIEFWREPGGNAIWISASWAATSVGRGWDSVGHAAGTYQNRIWIEH